MDINPVPVLRLYRRLLLHIFNAPLPGEDRMVLSKIVHDRFKESKAIGNSRVALEKLKKGLEWEHKLGSLFGDSSNSKVMNEIRTEIDRYQQELQETQDRTRSALERSRRTQKKPRINALPKYKEEPSGDHQAISDLKSQNIINYKTQVARLQNQGALSIRQPIDCEYINTIMIPWYRTQQLNAYEKKRLERQTKSNGSIPRVKTTGSGVGQISFMEICGERRGSARRGAFMRNIKQFDPTTSLKILEEKADLATQHAKWESEVLNCPLQETTNHWVGELERQMSQLKHKRTKYRTQTYEHRRHLLARRDYLIPIHEKRFEKRLEQSKRKHQPKIAHKYTFDLVY